MKQLGSHESTIEHTHRLLSTMLFGTSREVDPQRRLRPDSREMASAVQDTVSAMMPLVTQHNLTELTDFEFFRQEFLQTSGFAFGGIDYGQDVDVPGLAGL
jgi:enoyl-[acyl-carrier protein] reductase/trans-2-enoyl-CoA reductase (NAD+)